MQSKGEEKGILAINKLSHDVSRRCRPELNDINLPEREGREDERKRPWMNNQETQDEEKDKLTPTTIITNTILHGDYS